MVFIIGKYIKRSLLVSLSLVLILALFKVNFSRKAFLFQKIFVNNLVNLDYSFTESNLDKESYWFLLKIPSIDLENEVYKKESSFNSVSYGVQVLDISDKERRCFFLAAHSGSEKYGYFNDLVKLSLGDVVILNFSNEKLYYVVDDIYSIVKNGYMDIDGNINDSLYLITCSLKYNDIQNVYHCHYVYSEVM